MYLTGMKPPRGFVKLLAIFCSSSLAIAQTAPSEKQGSNADLVKGDEAQVRHELAVQMNDAVEHSGSQGLERIANDLRKSRAQMADGTWHLLIFYRLLCNEWADKGVIPEAAWKKRQQALESWVKSMPTSISARVAMARFYKNYAWSARGMGGSDTVTEEGWRLFADRLNHAKQILDAAKQLDAKCPVWWDTMHYVALGQQWDAAAYDKLFNEAITFDPTFTYFYNNKAQFLLPRWYGNEGDWQKFAAQSADKIGGEAGDILYARIGWRIDQRGFEKCLPKTPGYSWPRMKKGMAAILKQFQGSKTARNELAFLSYQAKDRACAKPLFEQISTDMDISVWPENGNLFRQARSWALTD
jgi:hypothetical protein